jgi:hypothetical protein
MSVMVYVNRLLASAKAKVDGYDAEEPDSISAHREVSELLGLVLRDPRRALAALRRLYGAPPPKPCHACGSVAVAHEGAGYVCHRCGAPPLGTEKVLAQALDAFHKRAQFHDAARLEVVIDAVRADEQARIEAGIMRIAGVVEDAVAGAVSSMSEDDLKRLAQLIHKRHGKPQREG